MKAPCLIKLLPFFIVPIIFFSCSKTIYESKWQSESGSINKTADQIDMPLRFYDETSRLEYNVSNDAENLYVTIRANDQPGQMKIIRSGLQLWIDTLGKNKKEIAVFFPLPSTAPDSVKKSGNQQDKARPGLLEKQAVNPLIKRFENEPKQMLLKGFRPPIGGITPLQNEYNIYANLTWDYRGHMNYKAVIPLKTFCKNPFSLSNKQKIISLTIIVPPYKMPNAGRNPGAERPGGGMGRGMGGEMGGGRMDGGGYGEENQDRENFDRNSMEIMSGYSNLNMLTKISMNIELAAKK